jgi:hypothetical protein
VVLCHHVNAFVTSGEEEQREATCYRCVAHLGSGFQYFFADARHPPKPVVDFGEKVLAVEFLTKLPWVIPEWARHWRMP